MFYYNFIILCSFCMSKNIRFKKQSYGVALHLCTLVPYSCVLFFAYFTVALFSCCNFSRVASCCTRFMSHFFCVALIPCWTLFVLHFFILHSFLVEIFRCTLHVVNVVPCSCCTFLCVAHFSCFTFSRVASCYVLHFFRVAFFHVALSSSFIFLLLYTFCVALFRVALFSFYTNFE